MRAAYTEVGEGFNPEVGFLLRKEFKKPEGLILYHLRPKNPEAKILEYRPHISYRGYWNFDGFQETGFLHVDNHFEWKSGTELHTGVNFTKEGIVDVFEIYRRRNIIVDPGVYDHVESQIVFFTNQSKPLSLNLRSVVGGSFGGIRFQESITGRYRAGDKFNAAVTFLYNNYQLPNGDFTANILRTQLSYAFKPNIYLQGLIQHNTSDKLWADMGRYVFNSGISSIALQAAEKEKSNFAKYVLQYSNENGFV